MKLEIDGQGYYVDFQHDSEPEWVYNTRTDEWFLASNGTTYCYFYEANEASMKRVREGQEPAHGWATCGPNDQFRKAFGRKLSLTRALENHSRDFRSRVWAAYFAAMPGDAR